MAAASVRVLRPSPGSVTTRAPNERSMVFITIPRKPRVLNDTALRLRTSLYAVMAPTRFDSCQMA